MPTLTECLCIAVVTLSSTSRKEISVKILACIIAVLISCILFAGCVQQPESITPEQNQTSAMPSPGVTEDVITVSPATSRTTAVPSPVWSSYRSVKTMVNPATSRTIMTDAEGRPLYFTIRDIPGNSPSICRACSDQWIPFYTRAISEDPAIHFEDFRSITYSDGKKQSTYVGRPLYYYRDDYAAGITTGDGIDSEWFVMNPFYTFMTIKNDTLGTFLTTHGGWTLYVSANETPGASSHTYDEGWCPYYENNPIIVPSNLRNVSFSTITRPDGFLQFTCNGMPLYHSVRNRSAFRPGDTSGHGVDGVWSLVFVD